MPMTFGVVNAYEAEKVQRESPADAGSFLDLSLPIGALTESSP